MDEPQSAQSLCREQELPGLCFPESSASRCLLCCNSCIPTTAWTCLGKHWHLKQLQSHPVRRNRKISVRKAKSSYRQPVFLISRAPALYLQHGFYHTKEKCSWDQNKAIHHLFLHSGKTKQKRQRNEMVNEELGIRGQDVEFRFCPDTENLTQFPHEDNKLWT